MEYSCVVITRNMARTLVSDRSAPIERWADEVAPLFDVGPLYFPLSRLEETDAEALRLATAINVALCRGMARRGLGDLVPEIDVKRPGRERFEADGFRSQLPHHDGQHLSYLTPSLDDDPGFSLDDRIFSLTPLSITSDNHKITHGLFVEIPGEGPSITVYYNLVEILFDAYRHLVGEPGPSVTDVARWLGRNTRSAIVRLAPYGGRYLSLGARLGLQSPGYAPFQVFGRMAYDEAQKQGNPELVERARGCPCGACAGESERLFCWSTTEGLGCSYPELRARYEVGIRNVRHDLILADNLALLHGQPQGHHTRRTTNLYMVLEAARGPQYERYLASRWRVFAPSGHGSTRPAGTATTPGPPGSVATGSTAAGRP